MSSHSILIDGSIVHYVSLGRGQPVIFLHSWVGSWQYWFNAMQVASRSFRTYSLDFWGFGDSAHNVPHYSLDGLTTLLDNFLDELGIGKVAIVGHGLGALVGMNFAIHHRQSVDRMIAISCPLNHDAVNPRLQTNRAQELVDWLSNKSPEATTALSDAYKTDTKAIIASLAELPLDSLFGNFRSLDIPCLLVYGEKDQAINHPPYEMVASTYMHSVVFEKSGHFPMIDESILFERVLMDFLFLKSGAFPGDIRKLY